MSRPAPDLMRLWAKGAPATDQDPYHPLAYHLTDVAAVAAALWEEAVPRAVRTWVAAGFGIGEDDTSCWVAFLAGLHDVGKCSVAFYHRVRQPRLPHGVVSTVAIEEILTEPPYGLDRRLAGTFATAVGGHHGVFPRPSELMPECLPARLVGRGEWRERRRELVDLVAQVVGIGPSAAPRRVDPARAVWLAGFVSVADWIGSNTEFFPFAAPDGTPPTRDDLPAYAGLAAEQARDALGALGWLSGRGEVAPATWSTLFPNVPEPNAMQRKVLDLAGGLTKPGLVVVEAPMGVGKTEAALALADRAATDLGLNGHYVALPTQATADQMFGRVAAFLIERHPEEAVNAALLHGRALLVRPPVVPQEVAPDDGTGGREATVRAAEWFCQRKRGLLAPFGVGTVDQALLAVLQTRHHFVRLFGLAGKTVVVDEVHAYDAYMSTLLERLLAWLAALGCRVVLLSATLPRRRRDDLVAAYAAGLGGVAEPAGAKAAYPRLTWLAAGNRHELALGGLGSGEVPPIRLEWLAAGDDEGVGAIVAALERELADWGCAAVVCNTVGQAQKVYRALRERPAFQGAASDGEPVLDLLHARLLAGERHRRTERVLHRFGPSASATTRPDRVVLVATQVIEQSLDLDFDLLVSEFAPVDLLLQRAGRMHRHRKSARVPPERLAVPRLLLIAPPVDDDVPRFRRGMARVYDEHVLLRSWLALRSRDRIAVPGDLEDLIEQAYDDRPCPAGVPVGLATRWERTRTKLDETLDAEREEARLRWVKPPWFDGHLGNLTSDAREEDVPELHPAFQALTRLGGPSLELVCLEADTNDRVRWPDGERLHLSARPDDETVIRLLERSVSVALPPVVEALAAKLTVPSGWRDHPVLARHRLAGFDGAGELTVGDYRLRLDPEVGLEIMPARRREDR